MIQKIKEYLLHFTWDIAIAESNYVDYTHDRNSNDFQIIKNPFRNKWFADPFIYDVCGDMLYVFAEEFDTSVGRGRIALLTISIARKLIESCDIILEKETHLSYPGIYRVGRNVFVCPENADSGVCEWYEYVPKKKKLVRVNTIMEEPLTDATIFNTEGNYYIFSTTLSDPNGNKLKIFKSDDINQHYNLIDVTDFKSAEARMAGAIIGIDDNVLIRPSQDCSGGEYGKRVVFQEVRKENESFVMNAISYLSPAGFKYDGLHTYNRYKNIEIIDLKKYDFPLVYKLNRVLKSV